MAGCGFGEVYNTRQGVPIPSSAKTKTKITPTNRPLKLAPTLA